MKSKRLLKLKRVRTERANPPSVQWVGPTNLLEMLPHELTMTSVTLLLLNHATPDKRLSLEMRNTAKKCRALALRIQAFLPNGK